MLPEARTVFIVIVIWGTQTRKEIDNVVKWGGELNETRELNEEIQWYDTSHPANHPFKV